MIDLFVLELFIENTCEKKKMKTKFILFFGFVILSSFISFGDKFTKTKEEFLRKRKTIIK